MWQPNTSDFDVGRTERRGCHRQRRQNQRTVHLFEQHGSETLRIMIVGRRHVKTGQQTLANAWQAGTRRAAVNPKFRSGIFRTFPEQPERAPRADTTIYSTHRAVPAAERGGVDLGVGTVDVVIGPPRKSLGPTGVRDPSIPVDPGSIFGPNVAGRRFNSLRALAQIRSETGSLETAPSATQSPRCSHSGVARGQLRVFLRVSGDCSGSREGAEEDEARPRQSGGQCAEDRLANRVSWSGFRGIRRQRRTTVRVAQPRAVDRKSLRLRESASQVSRSYPVLSRVQNF